MSINNSAIIVGALFLLLCSTYDIRYKQIPTKWIIIGGMLAILWIVNSILGGQWGYLLGSLLGIILLFLGKITEEKIGYGDGLVIMIVGVLNTFYVSLIIFMTALFLVTAYGGILVCFKKVSRSFSVPFIPFYFVAFVWMQIIYSNGGWR